MVRLFKLVTFEAGKEFIKQGDKGSDFFIIKRGAAKVRQSEGCAVVMYLPRAHKVGRLFKMPSNAIPTESVLPRRLRRSFEYISNLGGGRPCDICSKP